jgi:hypothetical protein
LWIDGGGVDIGTCIKGGNTVAETQMIIIRKEGGGGRDF